MTVFRFSPRRAAVPALVLLVFLAAAAAADLKIPRSPDRWVTDEAGFLSPDMARQLDGELERFERETGHQVLVYIGKTTEGVPLDDFAVRAFEAWKPGRKGLDNGLILFIMADDRRMRIEVGYGLEGTVTDAKASGIVNDILAPGFRAGDRDAAVRMAVAAIQTTITGKPPAGGEIPAPAASGKKDQVPPIFIIIGIVIFLIVLITNPRLAFWLLLNIMSGGRGGGGFGGGGGGGFRGGGGRSGGGGASGGW